MSVDYRVVLRSFGTNFGKGDVAVIVENATHIGWSEYVNDVGEAFFSLSQEDSKISALRNFATSPGGHMEIWRNGDLVWAGWIGEVDETYEDIIVYGYSYISGLYVLLSDWDQEWTNANVNTIFDDLWTRATSTLSNSRLAWATKGTVQTLWVQSGGSTTLTMPFYNIFRKRILMAYKELAAYAISDTSNKVMFEITPDGTFNLWRNRGGNYAQGTHNLSGKWRVGDGGLIRSYRRVLMPVDRRTDLYMVGSSPNDIDLQSTASDAATRSTIGRAEEPVYLSWVRDATELERIGKVRLKRASRIDYNLMITMYPDSVVPYRATDADYMLTDDLFFAISRGLSSFTDVKTVVGQQIIYSRKTENVKLLLADSAGAS